VALSAVLGSAVGTRAVGLLLVALATTIIGAWASRNPKRAATLLALRRGALARATPEDSRLLAAGPLALFRPEATPPADPSVAPS